MRRRFVEGVLSVRGVAYREPRRHKATSPRSALELSEQVVGYEPESTKDGSGPNALLNYEWRLAGVSWRLRAGRVPRGSNSVREEERDPAHCDILTRDGNWSRAGPAFPLRRGSGSANHVFGRDSRQDFRAFTRRLQNR